MNYCVNLLNVYRAIVLYDITLLQYCFIFWGPIRLATARLKPIGLTGASRNITGGDRRLQILKMRSIRVWSQPSQTLDTYAPISIMITILKLNALIAYTIAVRHIRRHGF